MGPNDSMAKQVRLSGFTLVLPNMKAPIPFRPIMDVRRKTSIFMLKSLTGVRAGYQRIHSEFIGNPAPLYVRVAIDPVTDKPIIETGPMRGDEDT